MSSRVIKSWLPAVIMCLVIFGFSQDPKSFQHSDTLLGWILGVGGLNSHHVRTLLDRPFRKFAHFTVYFLLGAAAYRGFALGLPRFRVGAAVRSLIFCLAYAVTDEIHQGLLPSRGAFQLSDVALDTTSAAIALFLLWLFFRTRPGPLAPSPLTRTASSTPYTAQPDAD